jgi:Tfp pilus assembly protein FimV
MRQQHLAVIFAALLLSFFSVAVRAASDGSEDTDLRLVDARVVEVTDTRISVIARTGVEHVIAIDRADTKVTIDGDEVSLKDLREGDVITVELDAQNPMMFAKNISLRSDNLEVARNRR